MSLIIRNRIIRNIFTRRTRELHLRCSRARRTLDAGKSHVAPEVFVAEGERGPAKEPVYMHAREETSRNPARPEKSDTPRGDRRRVSLSHPARLLSAETRILAFGVTEPAVRFGPRYGCRVSLVLWRIPTRGEIMSAPCRGLTHTRIARASSRLRLCLPFYHSPLFPPFLFLSVSLSPALDPTARRPSLLLFLLFYSQPASRLTFSVASFSSSYVIYLALSLFLLFWPPSPAILK